MITTFPEIVGFPLIHMLVGEMVPFILLGSQNHTLLKILAKECRDENNFFFVSVDGFTTVFGWFFFYSFFFCFEVNIAHLFQISIGCGLRLLDLHVTENEKIAHSI